MALQFSPPELEELAIEWALCKSPHDFTVYNLPKDSLEEMATLDTEDTETSMMESMLFGAADLTATVEHADREEQRYVFLRDVLFESCKDAEVKKKVMELLDEEIKSLNLSKAMSSKTDFASKAHAVAHARVLMKLGVGKIIPQISMKYDFEVQLNTLNDSYGGQKCPVNLYFEFKNSFWYFISILQDSTQLSTIPPIDLATQYHGEEGIDFSKSTSSQNSQQSNISSGSTVTSSQFAQIVKRRSTASPPPGNPAHGHEARGYTLDHGPWLYRIMGGGEKAGSTSGIILLGKSRT